MRVSWIGAGPGLVAIALVLAAALPTRAETPAVGDLVVQIEGARSDKGRVWVRLWDQASGYPTKPGTAAHKGSGQLEGDRAIVVFEGLPHGTYAASAHHDEDGDGKVLSNWIGMPKEGMGASNAARGFMGPPPFKAAAFSHEAAKTRISISLRYL